MIELQTSVEQDDTTRTRTPKPGYLNLSNVYISTRLGQARPRPPVVVGPDFLA